MKRMGWFYFIAKKVTNLFIHIAFRMRYEGMENIDQSGGFMVCSNHRTNLDPLFIAQKIKPQLFFMAKQELFKNKFFGALIKALGAFPVERGKGDSGAIDFAVDTLRSGRVLAMFPEGTRSKDGVPQKPKSGAALVAIQTKANVLPVGISFEQPLHFRSTVTIRYGKPVRFEELGATKGLPSEMKHASKLIMGRIVELVDIPQNAALPQAQKDPGLKK